MTRTTWLLASAAITGVLGTSCAARTLSPQPPPPTSSDKPATDEEPSAKGGVWAACYESFTPGGEPKTDLTRLTRECGPTGGMQAITPMHVGAQNEKDPADRYTFYVPNASACYRVYAMGDRNVQDLDLLLRGPDGQDVVADVTHDSFPVLPPHGPICFDAPGLYLLEVSVFRGGGKYALQVWGNTSGLGKPAAQKP